MNQSYSFLFDNSFCCKVSYSYNYFWLHNLKKFELLKIMQPKVIVTIGNFATERIIKQKGITLIHGKIFSLGEIHVVPVIHPANLLYNGRNPQLLESMKKDFEIIASLLKTTKT